MIPKNGVQSGCARGYLGISTPLAQALLNQPTGAIIPYKQAEILQRLIFFSASVFLGISKICENRL